ncbi:MAG: hydrogenase maturation protease [Cyclobacteriaceae bacterium]|nr:hydrogenase maturation protease [Cyclobacteriaceae bacterium]
MRILLYGYGNPSRGDDALGPALVERLQNTFADKLDYRVSMQLSIEDALNIAGYDTVIFADASRVVDSDYGLVKLQASSQVSFSMHAITPAYVLHLCNKYMSESPECYALHLKGFQWELGQPLSERASCALEGAYRFAIMWIGQELTKPAKCFSG